MGRLFIPQPVGFLLLGQLTGANFNTTADQPIQILLPAGSRYRINNVFVTRPSISMTTAVGGLYTGAAKSGLAIVAASQVYSALTTNAANTAGSLLIPTIAQNAFIQADTLFFSLTTAQGAAATADIHIIGTLLP